MPERPHGARPRPGRGALTMAWLAATLRELAGLFVDDGSLALLAVIWLAACGVALRWLGLDPAWAGLLLFAGLALALLTSALRAARRRPG